MESSKVTNMSTETESNSEKSFTWDTTDKFSSKLITCVQYAILNSTWWTPKNSWFSFKMAAKRLSFELSICKKSDRNTECYCGSWNRTGKRHEILEMLCVPRNSTFGGCPWTWTTIREVILVHTDSVLQLQLDQRG